MILQKILVKINETMISVTPLNKLGITVDKVDDDHLDYWPRRSR